MTTNVDSAVIERRFGGTILRGVLLLGILCGGTTLLATGCAKEREREVVRQEERQEEGEVETVSPGTMIVE